MRKICTECKWYPNKIWRKIFGIKPSFSRYAKCQHPETRNLDGSQSYCENQRMFRTTECSDSGNLFESIYENKSTEVKEIKEIN